MSFHYIYVAINAIKHFRFGAFFWCIQRTDYTLAKTHNNGEQPHEEQFAGIEFRKTSV